MTHSFTSLCMGLVLGAGVISMALAEVPAEQDTTVVLCTAKSTPPLIRAHAGFAADIETGVIYFEKNADAQLPLASLTKLMTVDTALEVLSGEAEVTITKDALSTEGESGLVRGERWSVSDLALFTLIESSNDGAEALALAAESQQGREKGSFIELMNRRARNLRLTQTYFLSGTGLDVSSTTAGGYGSARDVATLLAHIALSKPEYIEGSVVPSKTFVSRSKELHTAKNTALLAASYPGATASKTGYTDLAGGNMSFVFEALPGHPVVVVALGSTREERELDARKIADYVIQEATRVTTCEHGN